MATNPSRYDPIVLLIIGTALLMASGSVVFTLLPSIQDEVGFATWGFGLIAGVFFAASLVAQLGLARHADGGHARVLLVTSILVGAAGLVWLSQADSLIELILARGLGGLAAGCWAPAARAMAIARRPDRTATRLGYLAMGDTAGLVIGPLAGSLLASASSVETSLLVFAALILAITPVLFGSPIVEHRSHPGPGGAAFLLRSRAVRQAMLLAVALFLPVGFYETIWAKHISNLGGSSTIIALSVALYGLPYLLMAPIGGRLGDRFGSVRVALLGAFGLAAVTAVTGLPRNYWVLLLLGVVEAAISAVAYINALAAMARACPPNRQATAQGLAGGASIAGAAVMALVAGPLFAFGGPVPAFGVTAGLVAAGAFMAYRLDPAAAEVDGGQRRAKPAAVNRATGDGDALDRAANRRG